MDIANRVTLERKKHLLEDAHYRYNFDRQVYFNREAKKAFSVEFIEDHPPSVLENCLFEPTDGSEWRFYFNSPPSESVRRQVEISLG